MIDLTVVNASETLYHGRVKQVTIPGSEGEFEVRPQHCPFISTLKPGALVAQPDQGPSIVIYIESGIVSVDHNSVRVLSDCANLARDENEANLIEKQRLARESLHTKQGKVDYQSLINQIATINAQLRSIRKLRDSQG